MKKILVVYAKYGGGHLSAAKAIQNYIEKNYTDVQVEILDCVEQFNHTVNTITTGAYKQAAKSVPWAWKHIYYDSQKKVIAELSRGTYKVMSRKFYQYLKEFKPDVVVSTHFFGNQMVSSLKKHGKYDCKLVTVLTDFAPHRQWLIGNKYCDEYCVSNEELKQQLIEMKIPEWKINVTGIPLSDKFTNESLEKMRSIEGKKQICAENNLKPNKKLILFFGGGEFGLGKESTVQVLKSLCGHISKYQIVAVSGRNKKMHAEFLNLADEIGSEDLHVLEYTNQVPELMSMASLVVTKPGGLTSSESLASGLPIIIINPIPGQEEENAEFLEKNGAGYWIKKDDNIQATIDSLLLNEERLKAMSECANKLAKRNSSKDICDIIMK